MPKSKREEAGFLSKQERVKRQSLYNEGSAAYESVGKSGEGSSVPESKVRKISHSKPSYTELTLATRKFKRTKAFARFKNEK